MVANAPGQPLTPVAREHAAMGRVFARETRQSPPGGERAASGLPRDQLAAVLHEVRVRCSQSEPWYWHGGWRVRRRPSATQVSEGSRLARLLSSWDLGLTASIVKAHLAHGAYLQIRFRQDGQGTERPEVECGRLKWSGARKCSGPV
jgi:hypothetical protein